MCLCVACFDVNFCTLLSKELLIRFTVCFPCIMLICYFGCFPFWLLEPDCDSDISPVPGGHWLHFTFEI